MNTKAKICSISGVSVELVRKDVKNIHLWVYPPNGRVRLVVPYETSEEEIRIFLLSRRNWIKKEQTAYKNQKRQTEREYVSGESIYIWGRQYRLEITHSNKNNVEINDDRLILQVRKRSTASQREKVINEWYRSELKTKIPALIKKWESILKVHVNDWGVKNMKTRWGTCNTETGKIWLNLQLAKKPISGLEYIVVHEMIHLIERKHNETFKKQMTLCLPFWKETRKELNECILPPMKE